MAEPRTVRENANSLTSEEIAAILPHRYPFALVDRILDYEPGQWAIGRKCVTRNEEFFCGHFPSQPVMPGVLILEALAQTGAVAALSLPENKGKLALFGGIKNARFRKQVTPGSCSSSPRCFRSRHSERYWFRAIWHSHTRSWQSPRNWSMEANARKKVSWVTSSAVWASRLRARM